MSRRQKREARFDNRLHAGALLAGELARSLEGEDVVVLAIPPDGVPVATSVAVALAAQLDLVVSRRILAPGYAEETLGAVTPDRTLVLNRPLIERLGLTDEAIEALTIPAWAEAQRAAQRYRGNRPYTDVRGRTVVLVDDGLTTGYTMMAAVVSTRKLEPSRLMVAVPVAAIAAIELVGGAVDDVISLEVSVESDYSVGGHYAEYDQVTDQQVSWTLDNIWREKPPQGHSETF